MNKSNKCKCPKKNLKCFDLKSIFILFFMSLLFILIIINFIIWSTNAYEESVVKEFDSDKIHLQIKEPARIIGASSKENRIMSFNIPEGNLRLYFDLVDYNEFVSNFEDVNQEVNINSEEDTTSENEEPELEIPDNSSVSLEENQTVQLNVTDNSTLPDEETDNETISLEENQTEKSSDLPENVSEPELPAPEEEPESPPEEPSNESAEITGQAINSFSYTDMDKIKQKVSSYNKEKIDTLVDSSIVKADSFDIKVDESKLKKQKPEYKWGYKVRLKDLNFMARIRLESSENIIIYNDNTLRIGDNLLSFSDLIDEGYKISFERPAIEMEVKSHSSNNAEKSSDAESLPSEEINDSDETQDNSSIISSPIIGNLIDENKKMINAILYRNQLNIYIERDFTNSEYSIGDLIDLDPTLVVIEASNADHLDADKNIISDIYPQVKELDGIWSETINSNQYVRVVFNRSLTNVNDISIFPRIVSGDPSIEVYEKDGLSLVAEFSNIITNEYNKVLLTNLQEQQDTFDLKIVGGAVEFDHIIDPTYLPSNSGTLGWQCIDNANPPSNGAGNLSCDLESALSSSDLGKISTDDYNYIMQQTTTNMIGNKICYNISENENNITELNITVKGFGFIVVPPGTTIYSYYLYVWNGTSWGSALDTHTSTSKAILNAYITSNIPDYINDSGYLCILACNNIGGSAAALTFTYYAAVTTDIFPPKVKIISPSNTIYNVSSVDFNFTLNEVGSCKYSLNSGAANYSMTANASDSEFTATNSSIGDGVYTVAAYCNDTFGNNNYTESQSFTIDTTAPQITINYPKAGTYSSNLILFNVSLNENGSCILSFDSGIINYTMSSDDNANFTSSQTLGDGSHIATFYCNDSVNHFNSEQVGFSINTTVIPVSKGGSSGGTTTLTVTGNATVPQYQLREGVSFNIAESEQLTFSIIPSRLKTSESHTIKIIDIKSNEVILDIYSSPTRLKLLIGERKEIDTDSDGNADFYIMLNNIENNDARFIIKQIENDNILGINTRILSDSLKFYPGSNVSAEINIYILDDKVNLSEADLHSYISNSEGAVFALNKETVNLDDTPLIKRLSLPESIPAGNYSFYSYLSYLNSSVRSKADFTVVKKMIEIPYKEYIIDRNLLFKISTYGIASLIVLLVILIIVKIMKSKPKRKVHKVKKIIRRRHHMKKKVHLKKRSFREFMQRKFKGRPVITITQLINKKTYIDKGDYIGKIIDVILEKNKIDSIKVKLNKSKTISIDYRYIKSIGQIVIIHKNFIKSLRNVK